MKSFKKIVTLILIQAFLLSNSLFAQGIDLSTRDKSVNSCLSPQIAIDLNSFRNSYNEYAAKRLLANNIILPQGLIDWADITAHGTIINDRSTNFKIGNNNFRVPPYFAGRVARLHITAIDQSGFEYQKMGIGAGQRKKTIAVVLVGLNDLNNQLLILAQDNNAVLKTLDSTGAQETIPLGNAGRFDAMSRQDSFLERSERGIDFINKVMGIGMVRKTKPQEVVSALGTLAKDNPKLKNDLPVNLAFFSQDYMLNFSENLVNHSHIMVLRDREQRGRFIAIADKLNPDNTVVFERRGEQVYILGENERLIIPKLEKHPKTQVIYFTDIAEGAQFSRNSSRDLLELDFSDNSHSLSIRKNIQLNVGADNAAARVLKVNQVTQPTLTGNQIKQRAPELNDDTAAEYPVYILRDDFKQDISVTDTDIDYDSPEFIFFAPDQIKDWPDYLSYGDAENSVYYQHVQGNYSRSGQEYTVYKAINKNDIYTYLTFGNDNSFTIKGIDWNSGEAVVFRNIKNIALNNIVTQLSSSKFIRIDPVLNEQFNVSGRDTGINPVRTTYEFKDNGFEQGQNIKMAEQIDYSDIQKQEDKKIKKAKKSAGSILKADLIFSVLFIVFTARNLFAAEPSMILGGVLNSNLSLESLICGAVLIGGIMIYRLFRSFRESLSRYSVGFNPGRRDFISIVSIRGLIGFLVLQSGIEAFSQIYDQLRDITADKQLRPRMAENLSQLAKIYAQMPDGFYPENKRLAFPLSVQYWQVFLNLDNADAKKAAAIYRQAFNEILDKYAQPDKQLPNMRADQLLLIIVLHIQGRDILIQRKQTVPSQKHDTVVENNPDQIEIDERSLAIGAAAAGITPPSPVTEGQITGKKPAEHRSDKYKTAANARPDAENKVQPGTADHGSISAQGRLLSENYALLQAVNQAANEKKETFFSLKSRIDAQEDNFVIRPIKNIEEMYEFQSLLGVERNFLWAMIFKVVDGFKDASGKSDRVFLYGVFLLDEYGKEKQIVAAGEYYIRQIGPGPVLNIGNIEVLPKMSKAYSGIGRALFTKLVADTFVDVNFPRTQGRIVFEAKNKGTSADPVDFYKQLGLKPKMRKNYGGGITESNEFELSLEDSLSLLQREFSNKGFSPNLRLSGAGNLKTNISDEINVNEQASQLITQAI